MNRPDGPVRVGQIGCGHWAHRAWIPNLIACPDAELVALCDVDPSRAEPLLRSSSTPTTDSRGLPSTATTKK